MKVADPITHYRTDAELFDYFRKHPPLLADGANRLQEGVFYAAAIQEGEKILDIGSGNGWLLGKLQGKNTFVVSVDLGIVNLQRIRALYGDRANVVLADAAHLPFKAGAFDRIIASEILEHMNEPEAAVRNAAVLLRPGGRFTISTPYKEVLRTSLCIHCNKVTPANAHIQSFDDRRHTEMMRNAGLGSIRRRRFQNKLFVMSRLSRFLNFLPYTLWRIIDRFLSLLIPKAMNIIVTARRSDSPDT